MAPKLKLTYWAFAGRAEPIRLMLIASNAPFEDIHVERENWPNVKPTTPFGQVPVLDVDGKQLAQSYAITKYVATLTGFDPADAWQRALADQMCCALEDFWQLLYKTFHLPEAERAAARQKLLEGEAHEWLLRISKLLESSGGDYVTGDKMSYADMMLFSSMSMLTGGFMDGVPRDLLNKYPVLKAFHKKIATIPAIQTHYANTTLPSRDGYKPQ